MPKEEPKPLQGTKEQGGSVQGGMTEASMLLSIGRLENGLMKKYPWVGPELLGIFETLLKIVQNIVANPYELKFRVLKKANNRIRSVVLDNPPVMAFLREIGFEEDEETFTLHRFETHELYFIEEGL
jgi:hypothetical protein